MATAVQDAPGTLPYTPQPVQRYKLRVGMIAWMLHRLTGVALVGYLCIHVWGLKAITNPEAYNALIASYHAPIFKVGEFLLLGAVVYHALNGMRIVLIDFVGWSPNQRKLFWSLGALAAVLFLVGGYPSIAALERLMEREDHRAQAAEILEPVFLQQMAWDKVTACLEARIAAEGDVEERKAHLQRLGQIHEDYLEDLDGALESYARLFREDPRDEGTWETLSRLARVLEKYDRLAEIYEGALEDISVDDEQTAKLAVTAAQLHDQRTGDLEASARLYDRALRFEPGDHGVFVALESVLERREAWDSLLALYREQAQVAEEEQDRIKDQLDDIRGVPVGLELRHVFVCDGLGCRVSIAYQAAARADHVPIDSGAPAQCGFAAPLEKSCYMVFTIWLRFRSVNSRECLEMRT